MACKFDIARGRTGMLFAMMQNCDEEDVSGFINDYINFSADEMSPDANGVKDLTSFYDVLLERVKVFGNYWQAAFWRDKINEHRNTVRMSKVPMPPIGAPCQSKEDETA